MPTIEHDTSYTGAWNEAMRRVMARDNVILGYTAVCATLLGVSVRKDGNPALALAVPLVTLVAGALVAHHDFLISALNRYVREFEIPNFTIWHRRSLKTATTIGFFLHTLPTVAAAAVLTTVSVRVGASSAVSYPLSLLRDIGPIAGWIGTFLFVLGRLAQLSTVWRKD